MSTRYSVEIHKLNGDWESIALFADTVSVTAMESFITGEFVYGSNACDAIHVIDMETGEVMASIEDEELCGDWEPADIDDDMGFDPYLGCFTDDC